MTTTTVTLTGNVHDIIDGDFDARRTKVFLKHNTDYIVDLDEGVIRLGSATVNIGDDGTFTLPDVIGSADSVDNLQATVYVDYADPMTRDRKRQSFGPYDLSAESGTVDITALEQVQHLDASFVSVTMAQMQALLDQAADYLADQIDLSQIATPDALVEALVKNTGGAGPLTSAALTASFADRPTFVQMTAGRPAALVGTAAMRDFGATEPGVIGVVDGVLYGRKSNTIYKSTDDGATWTSVNACGFSPIRIIGTPDGEVVVSSSTVIYKSSGWAANPATATFTAKITAYSNAVFTSFSLDGGVDGSKLIATEYNATTFANSRYVHISTDAGATWTTVWDASAQFPSETASHLHGCCYDPWEDRFWFGYAHGTSHGIYYSDDDGATWTRLSGGLADSLTAVPTVYVATDDGIVCGTDSNEPGGLLGIRRADPAELALSVAWRWFVPANVSNGQANCGFRDPVTGLVYVGFSSQGTGEDAIIAAGTATSGGGVWASGTGTNGDAVQRLAVSPGGVLLAVGLLSSVSKVLRARVGRAGAPPTDTGNVLGGVVGAGTSSAVGAGSKTGAALQSLAAGVGADTSGAGTDATATGYHASVTASGGTATGSGATAGSQATATGYHAAPGTQGVSEGYNATGNGGTQSVQVGANTSGRAQSVNVGYNSATSLGSTQGTATGANTLVGPTALAAGYGASADVFKGVALGPGTLVTHSGSAVVGADVASTATAQVRFGPRHLEMDGLSASPAAPAAGSVRTYLVNASGVISYWLEFSAGIGDVRLGGSYGSRVPRFTTAARPTAANSQQAGHGYDTTLDRPIWSTGSAWNVGLVGLTGSAALNFPSIAAGAQSELTITVTGAVVGDTVVLGAPSAIDGGLVWNGYVSAADTVTVRVTNTTAGAIDPASATWKAAIAR